MSEGGKTTTTPPAVEVDETEEMTGRERIMRVLGLALLLAIATFVAYQQAWRAGYIWQDDLSLTNNPLITSADGWKRIWLGLDPLAFTSFRLEQGLWGLHPAGYHWVNFALHAVNALLLWRLLHALEVPGAWLGAALFALHPVQVETVAWISARKNLLMGLFFLLTLLAWQKYVAGKRRGDPKFYFLVLICYVLALASSVMACTLPLIMLLISWFKRGAVSIVRVVQVVPFLLLSLALGGYYVWWGRHQHVFASDLVMISYPERILTAARNFWFYLEKIFWPANLAFNYPRIIISAAQPSNYIWLGAIVLLVILLWVTRRWLGRGPESALIYFTILLAPLLGLIVLRSFRYSFVADHYLYLASVGPLALVAGVIASALDPLPRIKPFLLPIISLALLVPLGFRTWQQAAIYSDDETLWTSTLSENPSSALAHDELGRHLLGRGESDKAVAHFEEAVRLEENFADAHSNLANTYFALGRTAEARLHFERAIALDPGIAVARTNLGILMLQAGQKDDAMIQFAEAIKLEPEAAVARAELGTLLLRRGRTDEGITQLKRAVELDPGLTDARQELSLALLHQDKPEEALAQAEPIKPANSDNTTAQTNYGVMLAESGKVEEAISHFEKALALDPGNPQAHYNLANALLEQRRLPDAMEHYRRATELKPDYAAAHLNLANALAETGQLNDAVSEYNKALEIRPDYARVHQNLATVLNKLGRFDEGMDHLQTAWRLEAAARSASPTPTP